MSACIQFRSTVKSNFELLVTLQGTKLLVDTKIVLEIEVVLYLPRRRRDLACFLVPEGVTLPLH